MRKLYQRSFLNVLRWVGVAVALTPRIALGADPSSDGFLPGIFAALYAIGLPVSVAIGLGMILVNGYKLMASDGDPRKVQDARDGLFAAITGIVFVILAVVIFRVIVSDLGLNS